MKIDLEKVFDKIEWYFVKHTLQYFNFLKNIVNLIMSCICTSSTTILVKGTRTEYFAPSRGIRQGDSISPYIFILCMEVLSHNKNQQFESGKWAPIKISRHSPPLSHLFFADNLVLMSKSTTISSNTINETLNNFCRVKLSINKCPKLSSQKIVYTTL